MAKNQVVGNPFLDIMHKGDEKVIMDKKALQKIKSLSKELAKNHIILFIAGDYGSGKSLVEKEIEKNIPRSFKKRKLIFSSDLIHELGKIPAEEILKKKLIVFIDKFELSDAISDEKLKKILDLILNTSKSGVAYVISCTPNTIARLFSISDELRKYSKVYNVPALTFEQAKKLIIIRLNKVRKKKTNSISPFTESQLKNIWKASNGNPRMILLLCASLYEILKR
ncbi:MAG: hypothetical protein J7K73_02845 [Nanoarchaeota archaeon]|nr:hypothetical protein [Nanoarchaeota archaeon]